MSRRNVSQSRSKEFKEQFKDQDERIKANTRFRNWLTGGIALSGTGLGAFLSKHFGGS